MHGLGYPEECDVVKEIKDDEGRITEYTTVWRNDGKTCEVAFDQDNGVAYIARYPRYDEAEEKLEVELLNPMTGD